jgi:hypothetical protein
LVEHVLRFENFTAEFLDLVSDLNFTVDTDSASYKRRKQSAALTVRDLYPETQDLIRQVYARDFELGGYDARKIGG